MAENDKCNLDIYNGTAIIVINLILSIIGTFGNFLIIYAVLKTPPLRQIASNILLLSLAITDLIVTTCAQPLHAVSVCFKTYAHYCVAPIELGYDLSGNISIFCSMFHLAAISIDRAYATVKPHAYKEFMKKRGVKIMVITCWGLAVVHVSLRVPIPESMMLSIMLIFLSYAIIIAAYIVILYKITHDKVTSNDSAAQSSNASRDIRIEKRVSGTIFIVIVWFSICALPAVGFYIYVGGSGTIRNLGGTMYMWIRTLVLSNSSLNFIIYSYRINHFRSAYHRILRKIFHKTNHVHNSSTGTATSSHT